MTCDKNFEIDYCEQGFQLHFKGKMFPFIDLWVEAPNPNNPEKFIIAAPILDDGTPTYGANLLWPNDNFNIKDVTTFVKVPFEDLIVNVPKNSEQYLRKMYGDDCLTRYVIYTHTDDHHIVDLLPHPKIRMKLINTLDRPKRKMRQTFYKKNKMFFIQLLNSVKAPLRALEYFTIIFL
jgi:hypothetical protein